MVTEICCGSCPGPSARISMGSSVTTKSGLLLPRPSLVTVTTFQSEALRRAVPGVLLMTTG